ncbi:amino acid processing protein [Paenibacillus yonginensis]|uniref:Amino acid processing protein n=2 Tax=Paenibacillus yonginensis TaxID=1462996 RepID=A0A1B1N6G9_9BACL|nr:amino acid processing protein [Paenibacillus yonginensis]
MDIVEANVSRMAHKLKENGLRHRPHIKSHKSVELAKLQLDAGAIGITVAKLSEAEVFVRAGVRSVLVAYPLIGADKLARFARLHQEAEMTAVVDSPEGAAGLSQIGISSGKAVPMLIEIDGGLHRGGRQPGEDAVSFAKQLSGMPGLELKGIMGYFGTIYGRAGEEELREAVREEVSLLSKIVTDFRNEGLPVEIVSTGSTPAAIMGGELKAAATEVRAGNYIFMDASGMGLGIAREEDCALRVIATVVSLPLPGLATIDAGTKTLSSDKGHNRPGFGMITGHPDIEITGLNEEHGFLSYDPSMVSLAIGERLEIIPNHSCVIPNLAHQVYTARKGKTTGTLRIDAKGCSY